MILDKSGHEDLIVNDLERTIAMLEPVAESLDCVGELHGLNDIVTAGASYQRQRVVAASNPGGLDIVVRSLVQEMRAGHPLLTKS